MNTSDLEKRLQRVEWKDYSHPCFPSSSFERIPELISRLFDVDPDSSYASANDLWSFIAHQGIVGSISIPIFPFLIERIETEPTLDVLRELIEIFSCFSSHLEPPDTSKWSSSDWDVAKRSFNYPDDYKWTHKLRDEMCKHLNVFQRLSQHSDDDVSGYAKTIIENTEPYSTNKN